MKKSERPEKGPACGRCGQTNRAERSFCRKCGRFLGVSKLQRTTKRLKRSTPKPISDRRSAEADTRREIVAQVRDRDRTCKADAVHALVPDIRCGGRLDAHEIIPRSAWPHGYLVIENVILVCEHAHRWIDNHPHGAHALGLHGFSWERPDYAPL